MNFAGVAIVWRFCKCFIVKVVIYPLTILTQSYGQQIANWRRQETHWHSETINYYEVKNYAKGNYNYLVIDPRKAEKYSFHDSPRPVNKLTL